MSENEYDENNARRKLAADKSGYNLSRLGCPPNLHLGASVI